jgi:hypothetical protein
MTATIDELDAKVRELTDEVEGEKLVSRHILQETRANTDLLAAIKVRQDRMEERLDGLERKVDGIDFSVKSLARNLPSIVAEALRSVLRRDQSE